MNTSMELGETLTITSALSTTTYVAIRSKTQGEVTIRVAPPGGCSPPLSSRRIPRFPSCKLSPLSKFTSIPPLDPLRPSSAPLPPQDKSALKGWVMLSTPQSSQSSSLPSWNIAWLNGTSSPSPRINIRLESELKQSPTPTPLEEIISITELGTSSNGKLENNKEAPVKFEIKTKDSEYRIVTNSFITAGIRLMAGRLPTTKTQSPSSDSLRATRDTRDTPKSTPSSVGKPVSPNTTTPPRPINTRPKTQHQMMITATLPIKPSLITRTDTPSSPMPATAVLDQRRRSISCEAISARIQKAVPRPVSLVVYNNIRRNAEAPKPKDKREALRKRCQSSPAEKVHLSSVLTSVLAECTTQLQTFTDFSDGASNFSEDMSESEGTQDIRQSLNILRSASDCITFNNDEISDLRELTKGLSPDLSYHPTMTAGYESESSCFSEDFSDDETATTRGGDDSSDEMDDYTLTQSEGSAESSVSGSGIFDPETVSRNRALGMCGLQKAAKHAKDADKDSNRKSVKLDKEEKKKRKEAKRLKRQSKKLEKLEKEKRKSLRLDELASGSRMSLNLKDYVRKWLGKIGGAETVAY